MLENILIGLGIGAGMAALLWILDWLIKSKKIYKFAVGLGKSISKFAGLRLGKKRWEKLEDRFLDLGEQFYQGLAKGMNKDDSIK